MKHAFRLDPEFLVRPKRWPTLLGWSLNVLAGASLAHSRWLGADLPHWSLIVLFTRGNLLGSPLRI